MTSPIDGDTATRPPAEHLHEVATSADPRRRNGRVLVTLLIGLTATLGAFLAIHDFVGPESVELTRGVGPCPFASSAADTRYLGLTLAGAADLAASYDLTTRVVERDGVPESVFADASLRRVDLTLADGTVTLACRG